jgi:AGZA family xanthine/uracil permease-like MFS transporter
VEDWYGCLFPQWGDRDAGALIGGYLRRITPRAALLSTLAGIAITFISMDFAFRIFEKPIIALFPLAFILVQYFSKVRFLWDCREV